MPHIFEEESDRLKLIEQALESSPYYYSSYKEKEKKEQYAFLQKVLTFISEVKRELVSVDELLDVSGDEDFVLLYRTYQDILISQNAIDFDDLILLTYNLFASHPTVSSLYRRTYEYICIDEAQDLNSAQYQLLKILTSNEHQNVMMVGDPNQSIFAFNGSSSDFMTINFVEDFSPKIIELKENYRSSKMVLNAADKIMPNSNDISNTIIEGVFGIHKADDEDNEALWIYNKIQDLVSLKKHNDIEGEITYEKIVILARNKYVFNQLDNLFKDKGISFYYKITPGNIKFESSIMRIFDLSLRVKLNPQDSLHFNRLNDLLKVKQINDINILSISSDINEIEKEIIKSVILLKDDGSNFKLTIENLFKFISESEYITDDNEKKMILNDITELLKHWKNYAVKVDNKSLHNFKNSMALGQTHPSTQVKGVTLSTVHTMKGQEYEIVFLMGMDDETFPDYRAVKKGGAELIQEKNNLYVAFTRAKRFLYISWPSKRLMPWGDSKNRNISRFLKDF